jgi:adenosine deaminase
MRTAEFIQALPKAELHLHLEGAVPWAMARVFSAGGLPERPAWYADGFRFRDFLEFRGAVRDCMACLVDAPAYRAAAEVIFAGLREQNVRYAEISFDVPRVLETHLHVADVVAAIKAAEPPGLITRVFAALSQHNAFTVAAMPDDARTSILDEIDGLRALRRSGD